MSNPFDHLSVIRKELAEPVKNTEKFIAKVKDDLSSIESGLLANISSLIKAGNTGSGVAEKIEKFNLINSISEIHRVLAIYQGLTLKLRTDTIPQTSRAFSDAKSTLSMEKTLFLGSETLIRYIPTMSQRTAEMDYMFARTNKSFSDVDVIHKSIMSLISMVEEQVSYLNKLDSSIRLKFNIKNAGDYLDEVTSKTDDAMVRSVDVEM